MAGITAQAIAVQTSAAEVVRAMPNAAVEIEKSLLPGIASEKREPRRRTWCSVFSNALALLRRFSKRIFRLSLGTLGNWICLPALLMTALANQAVGAGLPAEIAQLAAKNVVVNSSQILASHDAQQMIDALFAYRGVTAAALQEMTQRHGAFRGVDPQGVASRCRHSAKRASRLKTGTLSQGSVSVVHGVLKYTASLLRSAEDAHLLTRYT